MYKNLVETVEWSRDRQRDGQEQGHKIGYLRRPLYTIVSQVTGVPTCQPREVVIVRDKDGHTCTIERPMSRKWIAENREKGNGLTTIGTTVNVPASYIKAIPWWLWLYAILVIKTRKRSAPHERTDAG